MLSNAFLPIPDSRAGTPISLEEAAGQVAGAGRGEWWILTHSTEQVLEAQFRGWRLLQGALSLGELGGYLQLLHTGRLVRIPARYWHHLVNTPHPEPEFIEFERGPGFDPEMVGQPIMIWREELQAWLERKMAAFAALAEQAAASQRKDPAEPTGTEARRGTMPKNAKPSERRDEEYAHKAAELVRAGSGLAEAIRRVAPDRGAMFKSASVEQGIRNAYRLMYDKQGEPLI